MQEPGEDTSDLDSVRAAADLIETPLQTVILNAGGTGDSTRMALTRDGVTKIFASNLLGRGAPRASDQFQRNAYEAVHRFL